MRSKLDVTSHFSNFQNEHVAVLYTGILGYGSIASWRDVAFDISHPVVQPDTQPAPPHRLTAGAGLRDFESIALAPPPISTLFANAARRSSAIKGEMLEPMWLLLASCHSATCVGACVWFLFQHMEHVRSAKTCVSFRSDSSVGAVCAEL